MYLAEGALGLPVFAGTPEKGIGLAYMTGPTGGYLVGFVAAVWIAGVLAERGSRGLVAAFAVNLLATGVILACGIAWLSLTVGFDKAVALGLTPFLLASLLKSALGAALVRAVAGRIRRA